MSDLENMTVTCCVCNIEFSSPILSRRKIDGLVSYCPVGHVQLFTAARERAELERMVRATPEPSTANDESAHNMRFWRRK